MGLVLMGGTVVLVGLVWKKIAQEGAKPGLTSQCAAVAVDLSGRGALLRHEQDGSKIRLVLHGHNHEMSFITLDSCTGQKLNDVTITADDIRLK